MKVLVNFEIPMEPFNTLVREGVAGRTLQAVLEELKPEAAYFYAPNGHRGGTLVVDIDDVSQIPSIAEPLFLKFAARCEFNLAMTPADLARAGLDQLGSKWA